MKKIFRRSLWFTAIILLVVCVFFGFKYRTAHINGDSMEPTFKDGDWIIIEKNPWLGKDRGPDRFDIVLIAHEEDELICKRIMGLPGETIEIKNGEIYLNNKKLIDPFGQGRKIIYKFTDFSGNELDFLLANEDKIVIPVHCVWLIGDNRESSWFGFLPVGNIKGLVVL